MFDSLLMFIPSGMEWIVIVFAIIALFFGAKKLPQLARSFGTATTEFEKSKFQAKQELDRLKRVDANSDGTRRDLEKIAETLDIQHSGKTDSELRKDIQHALSEKPKL